jgi:hypothetical protein
MNIKNKCQSFFDEFKDKIVSDIENNDDNVIIRDRINREIEKLDKNIKIIKISELFQGVCHAMISQVAKDLLYSGDENASISKNVIKYIKGVDVETAGLQLFLNSQRELLRKSGELRRFFTCSL